MQELLLEAQAFASLDMRALALLPVAAALLVALASASERSAWAAVEAAGGAAEAVAGADSSGQQGFLDQVLRASLGSHLVVLAFHLQPACHYQGQPAVQPPPPVLQVMAFAPP